MKLYPGEVVSTGYVVGTIITGRVIDLKRRSDGAPFLMIEFTTGPKQGQRVYPSPGWQLGVGPHEAVCERCSRAFRYQTGDVDHSCDRCWNGDQATDRGRGDRRASSWERKQRGGVR